MKILIQLSTILFLFNLTISCQYETPKTSEFDELDIFNQQAQLNPLMLKKYESVVEQIKEDMDFMLYSDSVYVKDSRKRGPHSIFDLNEVLHHRVFQQIENDSNVLECKIWMRNLNNNIAMYYENDNYPMDYTRTVVEEKDYDNERYRTHSSVISILRIFEKDFKLYRLNGSYDENRKEEKEHLIAKHYNVLYVEKDWIEEKYFIRITLFVKQNIDNKPKKVFN